MNLDIMFAMALVDAEFMTSLKASGDTPPPLDCDITDKTVFIGMHTGYRLALLHPPKTE